MTKVKKIAIITRDASVLGGSNQYEQSVLNILKKHSDILEFKLFSNNYSESKSSIRKFFDKIRKVVISFIFPFLSRKQLIYKNVLAYKPDLILATSPSKTCIELQIPFITPIHDLQHVNSKHLNEINSFERIKRELLYKKISKKATTIVVNSHIVKEQLERFYGRASNSIRIIREIPAHYLIELNKKKDSISIDNKICLPEKYLFYPAQFWSHKNHMRLLKAISKLKKKHDLIIPLVFVGSKKEDKTYSELMDFINTSNIREDVCILDYVSEETIYYLYKKCYALIFPSTNLSTGIPIAEAIFLEIPVICSELSCYKEQTKHSAFYFDPYSVESMKNQILTIWTDTVKYKELCDSIKELSNEDVIFKFEKNWLSLIYKELQLEIKK